MELQELVEKARHTKVRKRLMDLEVYRMINTILSTGAEPQAITQYLGIPASEREAMIQKAERVEPYPCRVLAPAPHMKSANATTLVNSPVPKQLMNSSAGNTSLKPKEKNGTPGAWKEEHPKSPDPGRICTPLKPTN